VKGKIFKILFVISLFVFGSSFVNLVRAQGENVRRVQILEPDENVKDFYFAASQNVEVRGDFGADVYVFGENVTVTGDIDGDLVVAGGNITVNGNVSHNVFAAGGNVVISGEVGNNLIAASGSLDVLSSAKVSGGIISAGGKISVAGPVAGRIEVAGQKISLTSSVGGNVDAASENLMLGSESTISGRLKVYSDNDVSTSAGASVSGGIERHSLPKANLSREEIERGKWAGRVVGFLGSLVLGLVLVKFFANYLDSLSEIIKKDILNTSLNGLLVLLVTPIVCVLLLPTIIGIPLSGFLVGVYVFLLSMGKYLAGYYVGKYLFKQENNYKAFFLGITLLHVSYAVIFVSAFVKLVSPLLILGSVWLNFRAKYFNKVK